jgi:arginyl-tRNA synthetase
MNKDIFLYNLFLKNKIEEILNNHYFENFNVLVEMSKSNKNGHFSSNFCMSISKLVSKKPFDIFTEVKDDLDKIEGIKSIEIAGPGFVNFFIKEDTISRIIQEIVSYSKESTVNLFNKKISLEYVSANPTGYLHMAHARHMVYGKSVQNILEFFGNSVDSEYYINDAGNQIDIIAATVYYRIKEKQGFVPAQLEEMYKGQDPIDSAEYAISNNYIVDLLKSEVLDYYLLEDELKEQIKDFCIEFFMSNVKSDLNEFGITFDYFTSEKETKKNKELIEKSNELLSNYVYEKDGAQWLKSTDFGDDKDRVIFKADGSMAYILPDIYYHYSRLKRNYDYMIDILGADHAGYHSRIKAAVSILGYDKKLDIKTIQTVKISKNGEEIKMSKRAGTSYLIKDLLQDIGANVSKWYLTSTSNNTPINIDIEKAVEESVNNPFYYVNYAYARISKIIKKNNFASFDISISQLNLDIEKELVSKIIQIGPYLLTCYKELEVHKINKYLFDLSKQFHSYYNDVNITNSPEDIKNSRLSLCVATKKAIELLSSLIGIELKDNM